jgi:RimJ/RimL family protein N-acetyltransferase
MGDGLMTMLRLLAAADEPALRAFLMPRATTSMFMLSNSRTAGLVDEGKPFQATYVGAFDAGELVGVAAHCWNGMVLVQAPHDRVRELASFAVATSGRAIAGFSGAADQVELARGAFELPAAAVDEVESLYSLELADLIVPPALGVCRRPVATELPRLAEWRRAYHVESLGASDADDAADKAARDVDQLFALSRLWVLDVGGALVAMTGFNAQIPGVAQVGGVFTPRELRGRGYARRVVAGSLLDSRAEISRAILFTPNPSAARAYEAIGFRRIGDYALVML